MSSADKTNIAIFASGTGSNADKICAYFSDHPIIRVNLIVTNKRTAGVLEVARNHHIDGVVIPASFWDDPENVMPVLVSKNISHIILAGFLLLLPSWLVSEFNGRIVNIHPALLPRHGGKGMYGMHVHQKVKAENDPVSGITIHEVNENYDEGRILFQEKVIISPDDSVADISHKVLKLEHHYYPVVIENWIVAGR